jgi:hypothetical protein
MAPPAQRPRREQYFDEARLVDSAVMR